MRVSWRVAASFIFGVMVASLYFNWPFASSEEVKLIEVPLVENWEEISYPKDSNNDSKDGGLIFIKWYRDPQRPQYRGMAVFYRPTAVMVDPFDRTKTVPAPFIKAWDFYEKLGDGEMNWKGVRVILQNDSGGWDIGEPGERLRTRREYNAAGQTISVTYTFEGKNSSISKAIRLR